MDRIKNAIGAGVAVGLTVGLTNQLVKATRKLPYSKGKTKKKRKY